MGHYDDFYETSPHQLRQAQCEALLRKLKTINSGYFTVEELSILLGISRGYFGSLSVYDMSTIEKLAKKYRIK